MISTDFEIVKQNILSRRTIKPALMNGQKIPDEQVMELLKLADWAPTHAHTEPWFFYVFADDKVKSFCKQHAELYKKTSPESNFSEGTFQKLLNNGNLVSHLIIACCKRGDLVKIPVIEEIAASSCAIQNLLLGANALGIAAYWGSGGLTYHQEMKNILNLKNEDQVLGMLYLGYTDVAPAGIRKIPISEKINWQ